MNSDIFRRNTSAQDKAPPSVAPPPAEPGSSAEALDAAALFAGRSEVAIRHGDELYRLRLTRQNKLILTK